MSDDWSTMPGEQDWDDSNTVHCSLCGSPWDLCGNGEGIILEGRRPLFDCCLLPLQFKLCIDCAIQAAAAVERTLQEHDQCEHGIICGEWCEACRNEYLRARHLSGS